MQTQRSQPSNEREGFPLVSMILPIRNEGEFIARTLSAVTEQTYPADRIEIIVADGMSSDETREIVQSYQSKCRNIVLLDNPGTTASKGLNLALQHAHGDIIVRVDGHTIVDRDYVQQCVAALTRTQADNVGGKMNAIGDGIVGCAIALATSNPFGVGGARFHYSDREEWVDTVYMGAWRRSVFERYGGFDEEMVRNQDDELNYRIREQGGKILLSPLIKSEYYNRNSFSKLWSQYFQYGYWKVRVMQKHPTQMQLRQFVPMVLVLSLVAFGVASLFSAGASFIVLIVFAVYVIANLSVSIVTALKRDVRSFYLLPIAFAILHVSYGVGFLKGVVVFRNKWHEPKRHSIELRNSIIVS